MYRDFLNFEQLKLLHLLAYEAETWKVTLQWGYLRCVKILLNKALIETFDRVIANQEYG